VGDLIGLGASQEQAIVGETPNLAARLQGVAEPNSVVIAESTRKLIGNLFELEYLGAQELKGIVGLVRAWVALRPSAVESRFDAFHASGLTELVGREEEFDILLRRWLKAKTGEGQVVLLSGEPGIGKSRLTAAIMERVASEPHTRLRYFCSPQHTDSAFYPIIAQMERAASFAHDDTAEAKLDKLDALLRPTATAPQDTALLAELLSLPNDGRYPALGLEPQRRRQRIFEVLTEQVEALSRQSPVLMIFEDAHWTDPTSLEALSRMLERVRSLPILLLVTFRPEFQAPWVGRPNVTTLILNRLAERDIRALVGALVGNKPLPASIREDIIERTDGIPLFVEEMTKAVLEAGAEKPAADVAAAIPSPPAAVPPSLHASLMARLDRLGSAKEMAQVGAAIGREFSHVLLAAVAGKSERELETALRRLIEAGLLFRQGVPPQASYLFKHALIQDAAYGTLLREPRRALHARIAETLEDEFADIAETQPELLARHCAEAGLTEKAAALWGRAGQRSLERSALVEAIEQLRRALGQIAILPSTPALRHEEIKLQVALLTPLIHIKGYAAPETKAVAEQAHLLIQRAQAIGETPEDPLLSFSVLYSFWVLNYIAFNGESARRLAAQFLEQAEKQGASGPLMIADRVMGISLLSTGEMTRAKAHFDHAMAIYDPAVHRKLAMRFGQDNRVAVLSYRSWAHWFLGYPRAAVADSDQALSEAREIGQAATMMYALTHASLIHIFRGNYTTAQANADELLALANDKNTAFWKSQAVSLCGQISGLTGKPEIAIEMTSAGVAAYRLTGSTVWVSLCLTSLARAYADLGRLDDAWRSIGESISAIKGSMERWWEAEAHRVAGEIALRSAEPDAARAQTYFESALETARTQQAKSWELRAAMSMARLWRDQGKVQQARELLAPVYGWFTEGFDTRDLKEAKALLEELAP
jgi:predicted ATPase